VREKKKDGGPSLKSSKETSVPFLELNTPEKWIAFMRDSLARILVAGAQVPDWTGIEAACGQRLTGSFAKLGPDLSCWKTRQLSLLGGLIKSQQTFPSAGIAQDGYAFALPMLGHLTTGIVGGALPTPTKNDSKVGAQFNEEGKRTKDTLPAWYKRTFGISPMPARFSEFMMGWPIDATALRHVATAKFPFKPPSPG
jgi:hypothetical protein